MVSAVYDFAAIAKLTKAFADTPPQNEVKPVEPESPAYSYSSGDLSDQPDYGMYAGYINVDVGQGIVPIFVWVEDPGV